MSLSRKRSLRARVKAEWSGILSSMLKPQNQRYARFTCTSRHIARSDRIANTYPRTSIRIMSTGSTEGRPIAG
jgi:hypothetical protein